MHPAPALRSLLVPGLVLVTACTVPSSEALFSAGNDRPGDGTLRLVSSRPADGDTGVPVDTVIALVWSGFPDPASVEPFGAITLRSGKNSYDYSAAVDLVSRAVLVTPRSRLAAGTRYEVLASGAVRGLDGASAAPVLLTFTAGSSTVGPPKAPPARSLALDVQPQLDAGCAFAGCHDSRSATGALRLFAGASYADLVGVPAIEAPQLRRVRPGDPAASYLLRKLLGTPDIQGAAMPAGGAWPPETVRLVSDWIAGGAAH